MSNQTRFADVYDLGDGRVLKAFKRKIGQNNQGEFSLWVRVFLG